MTDKPSYADLVSAATTLAERAAKLQLELEAEEAAVGATDNVLTAADEKQAAKDKYIRENKDKIEAEFSDLPDLFRPLSQMPDPDDFKSQAAGLVTALERLAGPHGHDDFTDEASSYGPHAAYERYTKDDTGMDWTGDGAIAFRTNFLAPLERVVWNQFNIVASLRGSLLAEEDLWRKGRDDACQMIADANASLDALYEKNGNPVSGVLTIIGAVVGVVAIPFTGGTSAALGWAAAGALISVSGAAAGAPATKEPTKLQGNDPRELIASLREKVADFKTNLTYSEEYIAERLYAASSVCQGHSTVPDWHDRYRDIPGLKEEFELPRPVLADATREEVTDGDHMGGPS